MDRCGKISTVERALSMFNSIVNLARAATGIGHAAQGAAWSPALLLVPSATGQGLFAGDRDDAAFQGSLAPVQRAAHAV
jgi:hypothetical protein